MNEATTHELNTADKKDVAKMKILIGILYLLQAFGVGLAGIPAVIAVIINYLKLAEVKDTWLETHFRWQINTFWFALILVIIGALTVQFVLGYFLVIGAAIMVIYRVVRGWSRLNINLAIDETA